MGRDRFREQPAQHGTMRMLITDRGTCYTHYECKQRAVAAKYTMMRWFSRMVQTRTAWNDADMAVADMRDFRAELDDVASWVEGIQIHLDTLEGVDRRTERIRLLEQVAGRTPEEAAMFLSKAQQLRNAS